MTTDQPKPSEQKPSDALRPLYLAYMDHGAKLGCTKLDGADEYVDATLAILDSHHAKLSDLAGIVRVLAKTVTHREPVDVHRLEAWLSGEQHRQQRLVDLDLATKPREEWKPDFVTPWIAVPPAKPEPREECLHDWQHHPDASGNNDAHWTCRQCGARTDRRPGGKVEGREEADKHCPKCQTIMVWISNDHLWRCLNCGFRVYTTPPTGDEAGELKAAECWINNKYNGFSPNGYVAVTREMATYAAHRTREIQATSASKDAEIKRLSDMVERLRFLLPENIK